MPASLEPVRDVKSGDSTLTFFTTRTLEPQDVTMSRPPNGRLAIFPGSFDPLTNGHVDIILRSARLFERIIVAVLVNADKQPLFTRRRARRRSSARCSASTRTSRSTPSTGCWSTTRGGSARSAIVRGLRAVSDFEYEFQMALMNRHLEPTLETVFMMPAEQYTYSARG